MAYQAFKAGVRLSFAACATVVLASAAQADNIRYVSANGNNANNCTLPAPCRTLQRGITATPERGELRVLDSGSYGLGGFINKSMTITGNGHTVVLGSPIVINQAPATVALRSLVLNGQGSTTRGIEIVAAKSVHIENCVVHAFTQHGVFLNGANAKVNFLDSIARDNGIRGVYVSAAVGTFPALIIDNGRFENNGNSGVYLLGGSAAITRSVATGNLLGIVSDGAEIMVERSVAAYNSSAGYSLTNGGQMTLDASQAHDNAPFGLVVESGGTARVSNSVFVNNGHGISNLSGTVLTRQNNTVSGNGGTQTDGTLTPLGGI